MPTGRFDDHWWPPSRPRAAKGGIRARSRRGAFARSWWGRRWVEVLEGFRLGARLRRGRSYARGGQVLEVGIEPGEVSARVQGSRKRPYEVRVRIEPLAEEARKAAAREAARRPRLAATLLGGEMPRELEAAFEAAGFTLFPLEDDLDTECTCPDWSNPCKHIAAVCYLVAEELDRDPFLLLRLRGLARSDLVEALGDGEREQAVGGAEWDEAEGDAGREEAHREEPAVSLPIDPARFWVGGPVEEDSTSMSPGRAASPGPSVSTSASPGSSVGLVPSGSSATPSQGLVRALGRIPFWRGEEDPAEALADMVRRAAPLGTELLAGGEGGGEPDAE